MAVDKFKDFKELGIAVKARAAQEKAKRIFDQDIKDNFDSIPNGSFKSNLPEINSISIVRPLDREKADFVYAVIGAVDNNKLVNNTWAILKDGSIYPKDKVPGSLQKYTNEEIALELVQLLENINPADIYLTNLEIIPSQDETGEEAVVDTGEGDRGEKPIDQERLKFIREQESLFRFANERLGFKGYLGVLFKKFIYLDNLYRGNAAFIIDLPDGIDVEGAKMQLAVRKGVDPKEISRKELYDEILRIYWEPISSKAKTKQELVRTVGAERYVHNPMNWKGVIQEAINSRRQNQAQGTN